MLQPRHKTLERDEICCAPVEPPLQERQRLKRKRLVYLDTNVYLLWQKKIKIKTGGSSGPRRKELNRQQVTNRADRATVCARTVREIEIIAAKQCVLVQWTKSRHTDV